MLRAVGDVERAVCCAGRGWVQPCVLGGLVHLAVGRISGGLASFAVNTISVLNAFNCDAPARIAVYCN